MSDLAVSTPVPAHVESAKTAAPIGRHALQLGRNYVLSLGGEGLQSGFHFILNLIFIRTLSTYDYGVFAVVFILGGISLTYGNALVSVPATIHIPKLKSPGAVAFLDVVFGSVALAISIFAATIVAAGMMLTLGDPSEALAGGAFVGLWTLRNHVRATIFARRRNLIATVSDLTYSAGGILLIAVLLWSQAGEVHVALALWSLAAANVIAILVALRGLGGPMRVSFRRTVRKTYGTIRSDVAWSLFGVTTWNIQGQGLMFLVVAIVGPAAYAPIAAGLVLFSPLRTAFGAFVNVIRPDFAAGLADRRYGHVKMALVSSFGVILLSCLAFGVGIWLCWGVLEQHIYGDKFASVSMPLIVFLAGASQLFSLTYQVPLTLVQAARGFKTVALATTISGLVGLAGVLVVLLFSTVAWSLAGAVAGEAVCCVYLWIAAVRVLRNAATIEPVQTAWAGGRS